MCCTIVLESLVACTYICICSLAASLLTVAINFFVGPSEPRSLAVFSVNSSSVTLQWMPPETPNGVITQYSIQHNESNITNFGNSVLIGTIERLSPDTKYDVQLRAHTVVGAGPSTSLTFLTCKFLNIRIYRFSKVYSMYVMQLKHF